MSLASKLLSSAGGVVDKLYSDDVFQAFAYASDGTARHITTGIDIATKGGMLWLKGRSIGSAYGFGDHEIFDSSNVSSTRRYLRSDGTDALGTNGSIATTPFTTTGFNLTAGPQINNRSGDTNIGWVFRRSPKFFDVVTYTGNGVAGRQIPHALGIAPGMVIVKRTDAGGDEWFVYHRSAEAGVPPRFTALRLNNTAAASQYATAWNETDPTSSVFTLGTLSSVNASGGSYVAYLFAHDDSADGIVQCGSFIYSAGIDINLGWEPQYLLVKASNFASQWNVYDTSRGMAVSTSVSSGVVLYPNLSNAEVSSESTIYPTATGFKAFGLNNGSTYIYLAIRRPNKPPTLGTQVYNAIARTGTGAAATVTGVGFAPDLVWSKARDNVFPFTPEDRLRGAGKYLNMSTTDAEMSATSTVASFDVSGVSIGVDVWWNSSTKLYINHFFKRAVGVMDEICYTGTGVAKTEAHGLGVVPELMIVKNRGSAAGWIVAHKDLQQSGTYGPYTMYLNDTSTPTSNGFFNASPTSSVFSVQTYLGTNSSGQAYVAYLFATKAGISKVGSYTGNGTSLTLDMGFTTGARFFMVKRTDATGDWFIFDVARGIASANDGHLSLNTTAAEVTTDDSVDPASVGIVVNQVAATNINVTSASYIYLSFA